MATLDLNSATLDHFLERIAQVSADTPREWGTMSPTQILGHLSYGLGITLGDIDVPDKSNVMTRTVVRFLFLYVFTRWPRGLKVPENYIPQDSDAFEEARTELIERIRRFVKELESSPNTRRVSEMFGNMNMKKWGRLQGLHLNHHLRQLGV